jgi:hypothetical protein
MADDTVTIELTIKDAESLAAYARQKDALRGMRGALKDVQRAHQDANTEQRQGFAALSALGKKSYDDQRSWSRGLAQLEKQHNEEIVLSAHERFERIRQSERLAAHEHQKAREAAEAAEKGIRGELAESLDGVAGKWLGVEGAIEIASKALEKFRDISAEVLEEQAHATFALEGKFRALALQVQFTPEEETAAHQKIFEISQRLAIGDPAKTAAVAKKLAEQGVEKEHLFEATEAVVAGMRASGAEIDPATAEAMTRMLYAQTGKQGRDLSAQERAQAVSPEKLKELAVGIQSLAVQTNLQAGDLGAFVDTGAAAALAQVGVDVGSQASLIGMMKDVLSPQQLGVMLKKVSTRSLSAAEKKERVEALAKFGLSPEDIDMQGESFGEAMGRLHDATAGHSAPEVAGLLDVLFGEKAAVNAQLLLERIGGLPQYQAMYADQSGYQANLARMTTGYAAAKEKGAAEEATQRYGGPGAKDELISEKLEHLDPDTPRIAKMRAFLYRQARAWTGGLLSQEEAMKFATAFLGGSQKVRGERRERLRSQLEEDLVDKELPREAVARAPAGPNLAAPDPARQAQYAQRAAGWKEKAAADKAAKEAKKETDKLDGLRKQAEDLERRKQEQEFKLEKEGREIERKKRELRELEEGPDFGTYQGEKKRAQQIREYEEKKADAAQAIKDAERQRALDSNDLLALNKEIKELLAKIATNTQPAAKGPAPAPNRAPDRQPPVKGGN